MQITVNNLSVVYQQGRHSITPLVDLSFKIESGQKIALVGSSGSGKSTLFNVLSGILKPTQGKVTFDTLDWLSQSEDQRSRFRAQKMGIIFQNYLLVPHLTAFENIMLPYDLNPSLSHDSVRARELLSQVGLLDRQDHFPSQLSGGECQRVAIARALALKPPLILADEPTGQLDSDTAKNVSELMFDLVGGTRSTFVLITHDLELASRCDRILTLKQGQISE